MARLIEYEPPSLCGWERHLPLSFLIGGCSSVAVADAMHNAVVDDKHTGPSGALVNGLPHYETLQQALDAAPNESTTPWRIALSSGRCYEKLGVTKPNIHLIGESREATVLTFDTYARQTNPDAPANTPATWTTAGCASITVYAADFSATRLTIENGYYFLANDSIPANHPKHVHDPQGVALMTARGSTAHIPATSKSTAIWTRYSWAPVAATSKTAPSAEASTSFLAQGELCLKRATSSADHAPNRTFCRRLRDRPKHTNSRPIRPRFSALQAAQRKRAGARQFHRTRPPVASAANMPDGRYADPDAIGSSVFVECFMDDHITNEAWFAMTGLQKSGSSSTIFLPDDSRVFEYKSTDPGAKINSQWRQLTDAQAGQHTAAKVLEDWRP